MKYGEVWKDGLDQELVMIVAHYEDQFFRVLVLAMPGDPTGYTSAGDMTTRDFEHRDLIENWERVDDPA